MTSGCGKRAHPAVVVEPATPGTDFLLTNGHENEFKRSRRGLPPRMTSDMDNDEPTATELSARDTCSGAGRTSSKQFSPLQKPSSRWPGYLLRDLFTPFRICVFPIILWVSFTLSGSVNTNLIYVLTESEALSRPPFNFSTSAVGYTNFAFLGGGVVGFLSAGPLSDWAMRRGAAKIGGVCEPEMRLPALVPYAIITIVGLLAGGLAMQGLWPWPVLVIVGYGAAGLTTTAIPTILIAYAVDSYRPLAGEIMVVVTLVKNIYGFALAYWVPVLTAKHGYIAPTMVQLAVAMGPMLVSFLVYLHGKRLRRATMHSFVHKLA